MEEKPKKIIIKNVKKGHGGHHGGSWKVAYADFVTAMMAFFLLMWLLNMSSSEKRAVMAMYFKHFALFQHGGQSFMMEGGHKPAGQSSSEGNEFIDSGDRAGGMTKDESASKIISGIEKTPPSTKEQVILAVSDEGIRIQIVDVAENPIFPPGSAQMTEGGKKIVRSVAAILKNFTNELAVEGHTDASPTKSEQVSNWELSTARASAARREIEIAGITPDRIARVVGFADKVPLIKEAPDDPRNRRISIVFIKGKSQKPNEQMEWLWRQPTAKK